MTNIEVLLQYDHMTCIRDIQTILRMVNHLEDGDVIEFKRDNDKSSVLMMRQGLIHHRGTVYTRSSIIESVTYSSTKRVHLSGIVLRIIQDVRV